MKIDNSLLVNQANKMLSDTTKNTVTEKTNFKDALVSAIDKVNEAELEAQKMDELLAVGEIDNLHDVTIAAQKAELTLSLAVEVNNKILEAYKEIMRLQI